MPTLEERVAALEAKEAEREAREQHNMQLENSFRFETQNVILQRWATFEVAPGFLINQIVPDVVD